MATPSFKVHSPEGEYVAACRYVEDAAALLALYGDGATIKLSGRIVYRNGRDGDASESYDAVAEAVTRTVQEQMLAARARHQAGGAVR